MPLDPKAKAAALEERNRRRNAVYNLPINNSISREKLDTFRRHLQLCSQRIWDVDKSYPVAPSPIGNTGRTVTDKTIAYFLQASKLRLLLGGNDKLAPYFEKTLVLKMNDVAVVPKNVNYDIYTGGFGGCTLLCAFGDSASIIAHIDPTANIDKVVTVFNETRHVKWKQVIMFAVKSDGDPNTGNNRHSAALAKRCPQLPYIYTMNEKWGLAKYLGKQADSYDTYIDHQNERFYVITDTDPMETRDGWIARTGGDRANGYVVRCRPQPQHG